MNNRPYLITQDPNIWIKLIIKEQKKMIYVYYYKAQTHKQHKRINIK